MSQFKISPITDALVEFIKRNSPPLENLYYKYYDSSDYFLMRKGVFLYNQEPCPSSWAAVCSTADAIDNGWHLIVPNESRTAYEDIYGEHGIQEWCVNTVGIKEPFTACFSTPLHDAWGGRFTVGTFSFVVTGWNEVSPRRVGMYGVCVYPDTPENNMLSETYDFSEVIPHYAVFMFSRSMQWQHLQFLLPATDVNYITETALPKAGQEYARLQSLVNMDKMAETIRAQHTTHVFGECDADDFE